MKNAVAKLSPAAKAVAVTPASMVQIAVERGASIEQLQALMALQERHEANEARKAYVAAMTSFKADPPVLTKNKTVSFDTSKGKTEYAHATLDQVSAVIGAGLSKHGISHRWEVQQLDNGGISVTCVLTHSMGHSERVHLTAPADSSGSKNSIQAIGSTVTYLQRYTLLSATGMAVKGQDTDGAHPVVGLDEKLLADHLAAIEECADLPSLQKAFAAAYTLAREAKDKPSMRSFTEAKDKRKAALK